MSKTRIPIDADGYSVNPETGTIHTRYATHAGAQRRTRTEQGVLTLLDGKEGKPCKDCYPSAQYPTRTKPSTPQVRRTTPSP